ncbi:MAG: serine hydrolase [Bacteroidetes bacterium]|nr:serine hydrolase [Bacteroidota bacterium]
MIRKIIVILVVCHLFQSCHVGRFVVYNFAGINDYKIFPKAELKKSEQPFYFTESPSANKIRLPQSLKKKSKEYNFEEAIKNSGTVAFLVIRNDSVLYEWYRPKYDEKSIVPSFSMAKSFVSALVGIAIDEGKIKSTSEPITNYLEFLDKEKFGKITIQHLLDMQSGIKFNENYINPFGDVAKYYYGTNLKKYLHHLKVKSEPGKTFEYISLNTQILALIIETVTHEPLENYLQEKIWSPIGMEFDASWSLDSKKDKTVKGFCCINARAKDFAKFGRLYLDKGNWNGKQIISEKWIDESVNFKEYKNHFLYSNQWWHIPDYNSLSDTMKINKPYHILTFAREGKDLKIAISPSNDFFADGFLGQYIYVAPKKNIIFVRLGKTNGWINWPQLFSNIARVN